ncbi:MAG TPA: GNAT family N-acetyltransferase [Gemmatimonadaceae bacterium]
MPLSTLLVRTLRPGEYDRARRAYEAWGYRGEVLDTDVVFAAEQGDAMVGLVRRTVENGTQMLRGMYVAPFIRRSGVGSLLLSHFVDTLQAPACWCVPYANLQHFYGRGGFHVAPLAESPPFLRERLDFYRREGLDVILMRRS